MRILPLNEVPIPLAWDNYDAPVLIPLQTGELDLEIGNWKNFTTIPCTPTHHQLAVTFEVSNPLAGGIPVSTYWNQLVPLPNNEYCGLWTAAGDLSITWAETLLKIAALEPFLIRGRTGEPYTITELKPLWALVTTPCDITLNGNETPATVPEIEAEIIRINYWDGQPIFTWLIQPKQGTKIVTIPLTYRDWLAITKHEGGVFKLPNGMTGTLT
jgi:hypothetical protein